jgi:alpha-L-fucosidase
MPDHLESPLARFTETWESLKQYQVPQWYLDAKFGIFIHWGVYSVPGFGNEWYPRNMYQEGTHEYHHHFETYGSQAQFGYKDFIPQFTAEKFDPAEWANLFRRAGARYVVPVAEHHDGFAMYATRLSRWNAAQMGPKRDIIGELTYAVRKAGMVPGVSSHRAEHWWFMNGGRQFDSDVQDPGFADFYGPATPITDQETNPLDHRPRPNAQFLEDWLARCCELVDLYQPQVFWFDWWIEQVVFEPYLQRFAAYYYNRMAQWGLGAAINYKNLSFPVEAAVWDIERGQLKDIRPYFWQTDTSISKNSWGYVKEQDYKSAGDIICDLLDIVSKNGCLLLNIGPKPDGSIPEVEQDVLLEIGRWLKVNGEAIYGTRPWTVYGEGPTQVVEGSFTDTKRSPFSRQDFRFTRRGDDTIYAAALAPQGGDLTVRSLGASAGKVAKVSLLGSPQPLTWRQDADGLHVSLPTQRPGEHAAVLKIEL